MCTNTTVLKQRTVLDEFFDLLEFTKNRLGGEAEFRDQVGTTAQDDDIDSDIQLEKDDPFAKINILKWIKALKPDPTDSVDILVKKTSGVHTLHLLLEMYSEKLTYDGSLVNARWGTGWIAKGLVGVSAFGIGYALLNLAGGTASVFGPCDKNMVMGYPPGTTLDENGTASNPAILVPTGPCTNEWHEGADYFFGEI